MFDTVSFYENLSDIKFEHGSRYLVLVGENSEFSVDDLPKDIPVVGAIFPRVVFESSSYDLGFVVAQMSANTSALVIDEMAEDVEIEHIDKLQSIMVLVDGLSSKISGFLDALFESVDMTCKIIGGGAGKLTLAQEPIIFSNDGILQDAALVVGSYDSISLGVNHGWKELKGPLIATNTDVTVLKKINYDDAFSVYKEVVEADSGKVFNDENFFDIAKGYPFGIVKYSKEFIVRDPITSDGKSMTLVGEMENNSVISILKGEKDNLIEAAKDAANEAKSKCTKEEQSHTLLIDCISRFLFLEESFDEELSAIQSQMPDGTPLWGVLTLGEIANANTENIEFYNKTCVVGVM